MSSKLPLEMHPDAPIGRGPARLRPSPRALAAALATSTLAASTLAGMALLAATPAPVLAQAGAKAPAKAAAPSALVKRGERLMLTGGCHDCHTPMKMGPKGPEPDTSRALSGHPEGLAMSPPPKLDPASGWGWVGNATNTAYAGPWGISYSANITSDKETGIGGWKPEMFIATMRTGKHWGSGRDIMPPMPWMAYRHLTDDELKALFAYLQTVPAVRNRVPDWQPPKQ